MKNQVCIHNKIFCSWLFPLKWIYYRYYLFDLFLFLLHTGSHVSFVLCVLGEVCRFSSAAIIRFRRGVSDGTLFCISFTKENSLEKFGNTRLGGCHCDLSKEEFLSECRRTVGNKGNRRKRSTICTSQVSAARHICLHFSLRHKRLRRTDPGAFKNEPDIIL